MFPKTKSPELWVSKKSPYEDSSKEWDGVIKTKPEYQLWFYHIYVKLMSLKIL